MKKMIKYIAPLAALFAAMTSCEDNIDKWSGEDRINFATNAVLDTVRNYSFVYQGEDIMRDTVWLEVRIQGQVSNFPRPVKLKAVKPYDGIQATPDVHYVDFESDQISADLKAKYAVPAGQNTAKLPIVLIRDASLKTEKVQLRIVFESNDCFGTLYTGNSTHRTIVFTDMLAKPAIWDGGPVGYFSEYGQAKHRFMIATAGQAFDDEWMAKNFEYYEIFSGGKWYIGYSPVDPDYMDFLAAWLQQKLDEENTQRKAENGGVDDPLTEDDGTVVEFQ